MPVIIDVPTTQLLAIMLLGVFNGAVVLHYLVAKPVLLMLYAGLSFFAIRFVPAYFQLDTTAPGAIIGNGIISGAIMWVIYLAVMLLSYTAIKHTWPEV